MKIQIPQTEIEMAIKQYLVSKGLDLVAKGIQISFTSSRKGMGVTADVDIQDAPIPGFGDGSLDTDSDPVAEQPKPPAKTILRSVPTFASQDTQADPDSNSADPEAKEPEPEPQPEPEPEPTPAESTTEAEGPAPWNDVPEVQTVEPVEEVVEPAPVVRAKKSLFAD